MIFFFWGGGGSSFSTLGRGGRVGSISFIIEDIVVSYTFKVKIPVSSYLKLILRGSSFLGVRSYIVVFYPPLPILRIKKRVTGVTQ